MVSLTLPVQEKFKEKIKKFLWINWSEIARKELIKKIIFQNYIKRGEVTDREWAFCEKIDWHPVDELPLKEEFKKKMEKRKKEKSLKINSVSDIFKTIRF